MMAAGGHVWIWPMPARLPPPSPISLSAMQGIVAIVLRHNPEYTQCEAQLSARNVALLSGHSAQNDNKFHIRRRFTWNFSVRAQCSWRLRFAAVFVDIVKWLRHLGHVFRVRQRISMKHSRIILYQRVGGWWRLAFCYIIQTIQLCLPCQSSQSRITSVRRVRHKTLLLISKWNRERAHVPPQHAAPLHPITECIVNLWALREFCWNPLHFSSLCLRWIFFFFVLHVSFLTQSAVCMRSLCMCVCVCMHHAASTRLSAIEGVPAWSLSFAPIWRSRDKPNLKTNNFFLRILSSNLLTKTKIASHVYVRLSTIIRT